MTAYPFPAPRWPVLHPRLRGDRTQASPGGKPALTCGQALLSDNLPIPIPYLGYKLLIDYVAWTTQKGQACDGEFRDRSEIGGEEAAPWP